MADIYLTDLAKSIIMDPNNPNKRYERVSDSFIKHLSQTFKAFVIKQDELSTEEKLKLGELHDRKMKICSCLSYDEAIVINSSLIHYVLDYEVKKKLGTIRLIVGQEDGHWITKPFFE